MLDWSFVLNVSKKSQLQITKRSAPSTSTTRSSRPSADIASLESMLPWPISMNRGTLPARKLIRIRSDSSRLPTSSENDDLTERKIAVARSGSGGGGKTPIVGELGNGDSLDREDGDRARRVSSAAVGHRRERVSRSSLRRRELSSPSFDSRASIRACSSTPGDGVFASSLRGEVGQKLRSKLGADGRPTL